MSRDESLDHLRGSPSIPVLVIGGGINGISVFRELAMQGVEVILAEKGDFCSGASAALSRMVHGGLRYLENGEFKLVREALRERDRLLRNAPHMVHPLPTMVPIFDTLSGLLNGLVRFAGLSRRPGRRGAIAVKIGLSLYDLFARGGGALPRHSFRGRAETLRSWPGLNPAVRSSATYFDAWVSMPERLGVELLTDALAASPGSRALNYASVAAESGEIILRDRLGGAALPIRPDIVVNATGGWVDLTNSELGAVTPPLIGGTKGSHLVVDSPVLRDALDGHMIYFENDDGRICILFPYLGKVLIGSTDIRITDPEGVRCEADERSYILQSLAGVFPNIAIRSEEVVFTFSGVRPLPASDDTVTGRIPRDHACHLIANGSGPPILCMIGGKWTTFRSFGEQAADMVLDRLGVARRVSTADLPIGGGRSYPSDAPAWVDGVARRTGLHPGRVGDLLERYGTKAEQAAAFIAGGRDEMLPDSRLSRPELVWLIRHEFVETLADLMLRRTSLALTGSLTMPLIDAALDVLAAEKGWSSPRAASERSTFVEMVALRHDARIMGTASSQQGSARCA
jgi:glycerol-3-phosphate dehydrogenase